MRPDEKSWLAAVIDSEGHLSFNTEGTPQLKIVNTNMAFLTKAQKIMGGKIYPHYDNKDKNPKHKPRYQLIVWRADEVRGVLSEVLDDLVIKKKPARVMLVLLNRKGRERFPLWKVVRKKGLMT